MNFSSKEFYMICNFIYQKNWKFDTKLHRNMIDPPEVLYDPEKRIWEFDICISDAPLAGRGVRIQFKIEDNKVKVLNERTTWIS